MMKKKLHEAAAVDVANVLVHCLIDDHSRVVLDVTDGSLESDYINASYIDVRCKLPIILCTRLLRASLFLCFALFYFINVY